MTSHHNTPNHITAFLVTESHTTTHNISFQISKSHFTSVHDIALHRIAWHQITLQHSTLHSKTLHLIAQQQISSICIAAYNIILHRIASHCNTLQRTASQHIISPCFLADYILLHLSALHRIASCNAAHYIPLQRSTSKCIALRRITLHCSYYRYYRYNISLCRIQRKIYKMQVRKSYAMQVVVLNHS
jgi:hypothetical protein